MKPPKRLLAIALMLPFALQAQDRERAERWLDNCERNGWNNDREKFCEVREANASTAATISVDGRDNGGVSFYGADRSDVRIIAMIEAQADNMNDARALAKQIRILTDGGRIRAEGPSTRRHQSWSVSFQLLVPRKSNLVAVTTNGGVSAEGVQGRMNFQAVNGGIRLADVGGDVKAETTNGGVSATLTGSRWNGEGLDLRTTNGGVNVLIPRSYNAQLITGTVNGGMRVDFPITVQGTLGRTVQTKLGAGGPTVRVTTTNGGVRITER
ncbi:MAG: DUF4097 family beta strand repeat protein [Gemmatimonadaceae bacterium]|nr:DUF4097 family beta strand repeat protein [Gemmatimonadaceae bacterium]